MEKTMVCWIDDPKLWIRPSAIIHQLHFKEMTNEKQLFFFCKKQTYETEFFICKAIGSSLRQYLYTVPKAVIQFVKEYKNNLSSLSTTEALKTLKRNSYI